jgi:hypothetical protein
MMKCAVRHMATVVSTVVTIFLPRRAVARDSWDEPGDHPDQNGLADGALGVRGKNHVREQVP